MKTFSVTEKSRTFLNVRVQDLFFIFSVNIIAYFVEIYLHHGEGRWPEFIFKTLNVLILIIWFIKISPHPFSAKNYLLMISLIISNTYPYDSNLLNNKELEIKISMLLPMTSYFFLILAFGLNQERVKKEDGVGFFFKFLFPFILIPILYFYFVLYQSLQQSIYLAMVVVYLIVLLTMLYYGININFSKDGRRLIFYSMAMITLANELNAYNFFVERFTWMFEVIRFLTIFSRVFLFCGFASEDIFRKKELLHDFVPSTQK